MAATTRTALTGLDALIFDMDGVVTETATVHASAWKRLFDEFLETRCSRTGEPFVPFNVASDYLAHVDGRSRYDGVRGFLDSRGINLPWGDPGDPAEAETVCGLGSRKDELFHRQLLADGASAYESTVQLIRGLRGRGIRIALVTASRNVDEVLRAAGVSDLFDQKVDGRDAAEMGLPGKPHPAMFLEAARRLGVAPERAAVVEDALAGVAAGHAGHFGMVIGVDRSGQAQALCGAGADIVVTDLGELEYDGGSPRAG